MSKTKRKARTSTPTAVTAPPPALPAGPVSDADYRTALDKAGKGDAGAMRIVRREFDDAPERWRALGNVAWWARRSVAAAAVTENDLPRVDACLRTIAAKEAEIAGPDAPILEKLLAARIAVSWFELCHMDAIVAQNANAGARAVEALDARRDRAHRRFRQSVRELAVVRRLTRPGPTVQVNAGLAQVNADQ
jgi:hypothetical protein